MYKIASALLISLALCGAETIEMSQTQQDDLGVTTGALKPITKISLGSYNAKVAQSHQDRLSINANANARVEAIYVQGSEYVQKGQILLSLQSSELVGLQKEYLESLIQTNAAKINYERDIRLEAKGVIAKKRLLESKRVYDSSKLSLDMSQNQLLAQGFSKENLKKIRKTHATLPSQLLYAPKSGLLSPLNVAVGEYVSPQKSLMKIYVDAKRYLEIRVPLKTAYKVALGDICEFSGQRATIVAISEIVEEASNSIVLKAELENAKASTLNQIAEAEIFKNLSKGFRVSKSSVVFIESKPYVFKKNTQGFELISVTIISEESKEYAVYSEFLMQEDLVVVSSSAVLLGAMEKKDE